MRISLPFLFFVQLSSSGFAQSGIITTYVGPGLPVNGAQATTQAIDNPYSVAADGIGGFYVASYTQNRVYRVAADGSVNLIAGSGTAGYGGDGGFASMAQLNSPEGVAVDTAGNLYIADSQNHRIRKVTTAGVISTVAGNGTRGDSGDGGPATAAQLNSPTGVAVDAAGNLYIADNFNERIRKVTAAGLISTVAGNGTSGYSGDGGLATAAQLSNPSSVAVDTAGNLYIADTYNQRIRKVTTAGVIIAVAGTGTSGYSGDGGSATAAQLNSPTGVAVDTTGNIYFADTANARIRKVTAVGLIGTVAGNGTSGFSGDGGSATSAQLSYPTGVAVDSAGNLYIALGDNNRVRKVTAAGLISTVAGNGTSGYSGDGGPAAVAQLYTPGSVAIDTAGNLYIADTGNHRIRKVTAAGVIITVAGNGTSGYSGDGGPATAAQLSCSGVAVDTAGNLYIADSVNQRIRKVTAAGLINTVAGNGTSGYSGDGGPAAVAQLSSPGSVAIDTAGNLYIADRGNLRIRKITAAGMITTVAGNGSAGYSGDGDAATNAGLNDPAGVAVDTAGNLYIVDRLNYYIGGTYKPGIRKVTTTGIISTVAARPLINPSSVAVDTAGNLYIFDTYSPHIRKVTAAGIVSTVAGNYSHGYSGDGGLATAAQLQDSGSVAVDSAGNLYIGDSGNSRVRKVTDVNFVDTKAQMSSPTQGSVLPSSTVLFSWTAGTGGTQYHLSIGMVAGGIDLYNLNQGPGRSVTVSGLPTDGSTVYVRLWSLIAGAWGYNDYTYIANIGTAPQAQMSSPTNGSTLTSSAVTFTWTAGTGVSQYWLHIGTAAGGNNIHNLDQGTGTSVMVPGLPTDGSMLYVRLWSLIGGGWGYRDYTYAASSSGGPKAQMISPVPGSIFTSTAVAFSWTTGTNVSQYRIYVGTALGSSDLYGMDQGTSQIVTVSGLPTNSSTVYVRLWSLIGGSWSYNDYTYTAANPKARMMSPVPGSTLTSSTVTFTWDAGTGVSQYHLYIGTTAGGTNLYSLNQGTGLSVTILGLPTTGTLYVRLWSLIGSSWSYNDYTYTAAADTKAQMVSPTPGSTLTSSTVTFSWTAGTGVSQYHLYIGTTAGGANLYSLNQGTGLSVTISGLPTTGSTLYVRLWSLIGSSWSYNDYTYTAAAGTKAQMVSPTPGSTLTSSTVTFTWTAGTGVSQYHLYIGTTAGGANIYSLNQGTNLSVTISGLPTTGTLYVRLWSLIGGSWSYNDYAY
jgi:trimeric autotransporter adhesin